MDRIFPSLRIGPAEAADCALVRRLSDRVFARFGDYATILPQMMRLPWVRTYVGRRGGSAVGFAMLAVESLPPGETDLVAIAVDPDRQGQGVGRALLAHVASESLRLAGDAPVVAMRLTVAEDNLRGRKVFEAAGFREVSVPPQFYPAGQPSLAMRKVLGGAELDSVPPGSKVD